MLSIWTSLKFCCLVKNYRPREYFFLNNIQVEKYINLLPNNNFFSVTKFKAFADNKLNGSKMMIFLFDRAENTMGKE